MKLSILIFNLIGMLGTFFILIAYFLLQIKKLNSDSYIYILLNLFGSLFIIISLLNQWNFPSFFIETCWIIISLYGLLRKLWNKKNN